MLFRSANTFGNIEITFPNYTAAAYQPYSFDGVTENNATAAEQSLVAGLKSVSAAITSLVLETDNNWKAGSTFTLYGLK